MPESSIIGINQLGLAKVLAQNRLTVPPNQRDYSWTTKEVRTLLQDFSRVMTGSDSDTYFLGTIVTIPRGGDVLEVVDGQQRLATATIILAVMRDYLRDLKTPEDLIANSIETDFLTKTVRETRQTIPRLSLNLDDNEYFRARLTNDGAPPEITHPSHGLINDAFSEAQSHIQKIVSGHNTKDHGDVLNRWIKFLDSRAIVVLLQVPKESDAYKMFETLNDRGLKTSQSDLIKNYLYGHSGDRFHEVQEKWTLMRGALETIEDEDLTTIFLRHALTIMHGLVREGEVYETIQEKAKASTAIITFANQIETLAGTYVTIYNPSHSRWNEYSPPTRKALEVLKQFDIKPMRPLILATAHMIDRTETEKMFQFFVSLGVRLMIASSTRTGSVEEKLADVAHKIFNKQITRHDELRTELNGITPADEPFRVAFEDAKVSKGILARYYLRSLEMAGKAEPEPWHIPNDDRNVINLEHILPVKPEDNWPQFTPDEVKMYCRRIGNIALLRASVNSHIKSASFDDKKPSFEGSPYELTSQIASSDEWTTEQIINRQKTLAELAVKAWPI